VRLGPARSRRTVRTHSRTYNKQCLYALAVTAILYIEHDCKYQCPLYRARLGSSHSCSVDPYVPATISRTIWQVKDRSRSLHRSSPLCWHAQDCNRDNCVTHATLSRRQTNFTKTNISFTNIHVIHTISFLNFIVYLYSKHAFRKPDLLPSSGDETNIWGKPLKADSQYHAVPLPCRSAKGLHRVFPIWFTQSGRVWFTHTMPFPCHGTNMSFWKRPLKATTGERHGNGMVCVN
jgi:hypothetical protein